MRRITRSFRQPDKKETALPRSAARRLLIADGIFFSIAWTMNHFSWLVLMKRHQAVNGYFVPGDFLRSWIGGATPASKFPPSRLDPASMRGE
jgi:hypothetical protein